jgi:hypothetical protein
MADQKLNIKVSTTGASKSKQELSGLTGAISKMGKAVGIASAAYFGARGLISGFQKVIDLSATSDVVTRSFNNLAKSSNFSSQAFQKFQKATDGTVSSIELMTQANNAMLLGITDSEDQMAEMFDIAQRLASALGKDTAFGVESLVTGLGRQSKLMLDNLGIMVDVTKANEDFANSLGKTVGQLTDQEKKQAFVNATLDSARELVSDLGEEQLTTNDSIAILSASFDNLGIAIGNRLSPLVRFLASDFIKLTDSVTDFIGPDVISREEQLQSLLEERSKLLSQITEKTNEAVLVSDLFTESAIEQGAVQKETIDIGLASIDEQIAKFNDLLFAKQQDVDITRANNEESMIAGTEVAKVVDKSKVAYLELTAQKRKMLEEDIRAAALSGQSAKDAMKSVVRAEAMEAVAGYIASVLKNVPFPANLVLAAGGGALVGGLIDKGLSGFADGGIVPGTGNTDSVPAMLTPGEVILNAAQQENLVGGMGGNVTVNISAPLVDETVVDSIIPAIQTALNEDRATLKV